MAIATEVAKVSGALRCGRERDCFTDIIPRPPETRSKLAAVSGMTLMEFLDETAAYARRTRKKILADLKKEKYKK